MNIESQLKKIIASNDARIVKLELELQEQKEELFTTQKKQGWFSLLHAEFESASYRTQEYLSFHRTFKREFIKLLVDNFDIVKIDIHKPNHFDVNGFLKLSNGNVYNFFISDLRWSKSFTIRKAKDFEDHTGESNETLNTEDFKSFMRGLKSVVI